MRPEGELKVMNIVQQIKVASVATPKSLGSLRIRSQIWLLGYLLLAFAVFGTVAVILMAHEEEIRKAIFSYFFPESWHGLAAWMEGFFFESQTKIVLAGMVLGGAIVATSALLFPLKEKCSSVYELESGLTEGTDKEFPLTLQAVEETKLFLLYLTAQLTILWIGYYPYEWASIVSSVFSVVFLVYTFSLDLISPTLQRHRIAYSSIIKLLSKNAALAGMFGALFSLPLLAFGTLIVSIEDLTLVQMASIIFGVNIVSITLAIPVGTHLAVKLFPDLEVLSPPRPRTKKIGYIVLGLLLIVNLVFHSRLLISMHHKSQFLKCEYSIDWGSFDVEGPGFLNIFKGKSEVDLSFDLVVKNPTSFDLAVEKSTLTITQFEQEFAKVDINEFSVASGQSDRKNIQFKTKLNADVLSSFSNLLDGWDAELEFELFPGIPFVVDVGGK